MTHFEGIISVQVLSSMSGSILLLHLYRITEMEIAMNKFDTEVIVEHIKLPGLTVLAYKCFIPIEFSYHIFFGGIFHDRPCSHNSGH